MIDFSFSYYFSLSAWYLIRSHSSEIVKNPEPERQLELR